MKNIVLRALAIPAFAACLFVACGGKTEGTGSSGGSSGSSGGMTSSGGSSGSGSSSGGFSSSSGSSGGGTTCLRIDLSTYDLSCMQASDCVYVSAGEICSGQCDCPDAVINASDQARYNQAIAPLELGECPCPLTPEAQCIDNTCSLGGLPGMDAGLPGDSGVCVDIELSTYDQSCKADADCIDVTAGVICSGQCQCGGSVINVDGEARYDAAIAPVQNGACPCAPGAMPRCVDNHCTLCGLGPDQPAGCPDGG